MNDLNDELIRRLGDRKETLRRQRAMERNACYAFDQLEAWRTQYPEKWVAVHDSNVAAVSGDVHALRRALHEKAIPLRDVYLTFVRKDRLDLAL